MVGKGIAHWRHDEADQVIERLGWSEDDVATMAHGIRGMRAVLVDGACRDARLRIGAQAVQDHCCWRLAREACYLEVDAGNATTKRRWRIVVPRCHRDVGTDPRGIFPINLSKVTVAGNEPDVRKALGLRDDESIEKLIPPHRGVAEVLVSSKNEPQRITLERIRKLSASEINQWRSRRGEPLLSELIMQGSRGPHRLELIEVLHEQGADLDASNDKGEVVLKTALEAVAFNIAERLIEMGANVDYPSDRPDDALEYGVIHERLSLVKAVCQASRREIDYDAIIHSANDTMSWFETEDEKRAAIIEYLQSLRDERLMSTYEPPLLDSPSKSPAL